MPVAWMRHGIICVNSQHLMLANPSGCRTTTTRPGDLRGMPFGFPSVFGTIKVCESFRPKKLIGFMGHYLVVRINILQHVQMYGSPVKFEPKKTEQK